MLHCDTDISIIVPVYNESGNIEPLVAAITERFDASGMAFEVLFVDDGSRDNTFDALRKVNERDGRFKAIRLKRNFGKSEAYMAGFGMAVGDLVATMDGDMQDDPSDLFKLIDEVRSGVDMAIGWKTTGKSSTAKFYLSRFFNRLIRFMTGTRLHDLNCPLRVMTRSVAKSLYIYASLHRYIPILAASQGYWVGEVPVANRERLHGSSSYSYSKYFESFFDLMTVLFVTSYRKRPLHFLGPIGMGSFLLGVGIDAYYMYLGLAGIDKMRNNIPSLLLGLALIMIGVQIVLSGLVGEMISRELGAGQKHHEHSIRTTIGLDDRLP